MSLGNRLLDAGDGRRRVARRAIISALITGTIFDVLLFSSKQTPAIYNHAPWLNDPYDTAVSFALFCVPLIVAPSAVRLLACRRDEPVSAARLADLLRACGVALAAVAITLASGWIAVGLRANRQAWDSVTAVQVGFLAAITLATALSVVAIRRAAKALWRRQGCRVTGSPPPDWLSDVLDVGVHLAAALGPAGGPVTRLLEQHGRPMLAAVRHHPLATAALIAAACAVPVTVAQSVNERYRAGVSVLFFCIVTAGVFAFLAAAGSYLRVIRSDSPASGIRRRLVHASVGACAAVPVTLAFRATLWSLVGANPQRSGLPALWLLLLSSAAIAFVLTLAAERLVRPRGGTADAY